VMQAAATLARAKVRQVMSVGRGIRRQPIDRRRLEVANLTLGRTRPGRGLPRRRRIT
jgi:hypothetical protein